MIDAARIFLDFTGLSSFDWGPAAMLAVCLAAAIRLTCNGHARHWPVYIIAILTAAACLVKMAAPCWWTWRVYIGFEMAVCVLALFVAHAVDNAPWPALLGFLGAGSYVTIAAADGHCLQAYVFLAVVDLATVVILARARTGNKIEILACFGLRWLLSFQAFRVALIGVSEPLALAIGQAGWAVHLLVFGLIAHAARR